MAEPFYLYTRRQGGNYYVQFRLEDGSLSNHKSTGTPNYNEVTNATAKNLLSFFISISLKKETFI